MSNRVVTPSLDEMVHIAHEMKKRNISIPLLIGGATTSRIHTAVKIAEHYEYGVVHVLDASRSVTVVSDLMNEHKDPFLQNLNLEYTTLREDFQQRKHVKNFLTLEQARQQKFVAKENSTIVKPFFWGTKTVLDVDLNDIRNFIDWTPFFITWEMHGKYPDILQDEIVGKEASSLYHDANVLLDKIVAEKWLSAEAVFGIWEAQREGDDDVLIKEKNITLNFLRQQIQKAAGQASLCLADFISAKLQDYIGAFAVTIKGIEPHLVRFEEELDDYHKIMLQALADRLAEACTELVHQKVRTEYWNYTDDEGLTN